MYRQTLPDQGFYDKSSRVGDASIGLVSSDPCEDLLLHCDKRTELVGMLSTQWKKVNGSELSIKFKNTIALTPFAEPALSVLPAAQVVFVEATATPLHDSTSSAKPASRSKSKSTPTPVVPLDDLVVSLDKNKTILRIQAPSGVSSGYAEARRVREAEKRRLGEIVRMKVAEERRQRNEYRRAEREAERQLRVEEKKARKAAERAARPGGNAGIFKDTTKPVIAFASKSINSKLLTAQASTVKPHPPPQPADKVEVTKPVAVPQTIIKSPDEGVYKARAPYTPPSIPPPVLPPSQPISPPPRPPSAKTYEPVDDLSPRPPPPRPPAPKTPVASITQAAITPNTVDSSPGFGINSNKLDRTSIEPSYSPISPRVELSPAPASLSDKPYVIPPPKRAPPSPVSPPSSPPAQEEVLTASPVRAPPPAPRAPPPKPTLEIAPPSVIQDLVVEAPVIAPPAIPAPPSRLPPPPRRMQAASEDSFESSSVNTSESEPLDVKFTTSEPLALKSTPAIPIPPPMARPQPPPPAPLRPAPPAPVPFPIYAPPRPVLPKASVADTNMASRSGDSSDNWDSGSDVGDNVISSSRGAAPSAPVVGALMSTSGDSADALDMGQMYPADEDDGKVNEPLFDEPIGSLSKQPSASGVGAVAMHVSEKQSQEQIASYSKPSDAKAASILSPRQTSATPAASLGAVYQKPWTPRKVVEQAPVSTPLIAEATPSAAVAPVPTEPPVAPSAKVTFIEPSVDSDLPLVTPPPPPPLGRPESTKSALSHVSLDESPRSLVSGLTMSVKTLHPPIAPSRSDSARSLPAQEAVIGHIHDIGGSSDSWSVHSDNELFESPRPAAATKLTPQRAGTGGSRGIASAIAVHESIPVVPNQVAAPTPAVRPALPTPVAALAEPIKGTVPTAPTNTQTTPSWVKQSPLKPVAHTIATKPIISPQVYASPSPVGPRPWQPPASGKPHNSATKGSSAIAASIKAKASGNATTTAITPSKLTPVIEQAEGTEQDTKATSTTASAAPSLLPRSFPPRPMPARPTAPK